MTDAYAFQVLCARYDRMIDALNACLAAEISTDNATYAIEIIERDLRKFGSKVAEIKVVINGPHFSRVAAMHKGRVVQRIGRSLWEATNTLVQFLLDEEGK